MNYKEILTTPTEELLEKKSSLENEYEAIEHTVSKIDAEIFYRKNPKCRPKPNYCSVCGEGDDLPQVKCAKEDCPH